MSEQYDGPQMAQQIMRLQNQLTAARKECEEAKAEIERAYEKNGASQRAWLREKEKVEKLEAVRVAAETVKKRCLKWGILPKGQTCHDIESWKGDNDLSCHGCRLSKALAAAKGEGA